MPSDMRGKRKKQQQQQQQQQLVEKIFRSTENVVGFYVPPLTWEQNGTKSNSATLLVELLVLLSNHQAFVAFSNLGERFF